MSEPGTGRTQPAVNSLAEHFPELGRRLARRPIAQSPTPLEPLLRLGKAIGAPHLLAKRDDLSGEPYGGNKVRKLEYLLGDALAQGCDSVLTFGAAGSNHALATAIYAIQAGLGCDAVLTRQVRTAYVAGTLRWHALIGTRIHAATGLEGTRALADRIRSEHPGGPARMYEIPWGGSSLLGTTGFVAAGLEFAAQFRAAGFQRPARIYLPCGTMGSAAGLALGLGAAGLPATVVSVKVVPHDAVSDQAIHRLMESTNRELHGRDPGFPLLPAASSCIEFRTGYLGGGYAHASPEAEAAAGLALDLEGLTADTTYSAKALACLLEDARSGRLADCVPVFWQTYNSRPCPAGLDSADTSGLPESFRYFLAAD